MAPDNRCRGSLPIIRGLEHLPEKRLRSLIRITFGRRMPEKPELLRWAIENGLYESRPMEVARKLLATEPATIQQPRRYLN